MEVFHCGLIDVFNFLQVMEKGYKRLTPEQPVGLRHAGYVISVQKVIKVNVQVISFNISVIQEIQETLSQNHF